jgi:predicted transcriptional regulator
MESLSLTDLQIDVMRVLWTRGEATVIDVHRALEGSRALAQPTVATLLMRLEKKGAVGHRTEGRQFVYRALVDESAVRRGMLSQLTNGLFGGDLPQLMNHLLSSREVRKDDLEQVKAMIARKEQELAESESAETKGKRPKSRGK